MPLRNEIFEGIAAYKALAPTGHDAYYEELADEKRRQNRRENEADAARKKEEAAKNAQGTTGTTAAGTPPVPGTAVPTVASTASPGTQATRPQGAVPTVAAPIAPYPRQAASPDVGIPGIHPYASTILNQALDPNVAPMGGRQGGMGMPYSARGGRIPHFQYGGTYRGQPEQTADDTTDVDQLVLQAIGQQPPTQQAPGPMSPMPSPVDRMRGMSRMPNRPQTAIPVDQPPNPYREEVDPSNPHYGTRRQVEDQPPAPSDLGVIAGKVRGNVAAAEEAVRSLKNVGEGTPGFTPSPALSAPNPDTPTRPPLPPGAPAAPAVATAAAPAPAGNGPARPAGQAVDTQAPFANDRLPAYDRSRIIPGTSDTASGLMSDPRGFNSPRTGQPGTTGPGSGNGARPAPPGGAGGANAPSGAPKPRKALDDKTRTEAYDPTLDAMDPRNVRPVDASGRTYNQDDVTRILGAAVQASPGGANGPMPPIGQGGTSRQVLNQVIQNYGGDTRFPGDAVLAGMIGAYKVYLKYGMVEQAAKASWGILQAANMEAAAMARQARDQLMGGNVPAAMQNIVKALNMLPDGMHHTLSPDGQMIITTDPSTGKPVARTPMGGKQILAMVMGIGNGSAMWAALQQSASMLTQGKEDKNAEGRGLSNDIKRRQIQMLDKRLAGGGGKGKGGGAAKTAGADYFDNLAKGIARGSSGGGEKNEAVDRVIVQNDQDAELMRPPDDTEQ